MELGISSFTMTQEYEEAGLECVANSPEEIREMARELNARIDGKWRGFEEDVALRKQYMSMYPDDSPLHDAPTIVATTFLRTNRDLLS